MARPLLYILTAVTLMLAGCDMAALGSAAADAGDPMGAARGGGQDGGPLYGSMGDAGGSPTPADVVPPVPTSLVHRLNRMEYENSLRDLFGVQEVMRVQMPPDPLAAGFDNNSGLLSVSPLLMELYLSNAEQLLDAWLPDRPEPALVSRTGAELSDGSWPLAGDTVWVAKHNLDATAGVQWSLPSYGPGRYHLTASVSCTPGPTPCLVALEVDTLAATTLEVADATPTELSVTVDVTAPAPRFGVSDLAESGVDGHTLGIHWLRVDGPELLTEQAEFRETPLGAELHGCETQADPEACLHSTLGGFLPRVYRRPVVAEQVSSLLQLAGATASPRARGRLALTAALVSPRFVHRVEAAPSGGTGSAPLDAHELASRLSYFLWSSTPDGELLQLAASGELTEDAVLLAQVRRMLADPKSERLVESFGGQWLQLRDLQEHMPAASLFPTYDAALARSMTRETLLLLGDAFKGALGLDEMLLAEYSYPDGLLAAHYGLPAMGSDHEKRGMGEANRAGLLGQASILTLTSLPNRTSPVQRGKWILGRLLCSEPPPPPPGIPQLQTGDGSSGSVRDQLAQHRQDPVCAGCHEAMDPLGLALERYDALGRYRSTNPDGSSVNASSELLDGTQLQGAQDLSQLVVGDSRYGRCVTRQLFNYALGRVPGTEHEAHLQALATSLANGGHSLPGLIESIVLGDPFRSRYTRPAP